ncbi:helicase RepA family protein [Jannaschia sp. W003]|uniref:helicase RepA family protein n=1 Tax=Jannaschia sp. W003 TaxID=2867012 RepID=UPI0021A3BAB7|nr:helicase RepA family protein [Jannaschia sp. W003]UWQ20078.1 helicase RepA family protein [Jannaschia sp. W003]
MFDILTEDTAMDGIEAAGNNPAPVRAHGFQAEAPLRRERRLKSSYTVKGLLGGAGTVSVLVGAPGKGKSTAAMAIAVRVADGTSVGPMFVRQGAVMYLACEAYTSTERRLEAWRDEVCADIPVHIARGNLHLDDTQSVLQFIAFAEGYVAKGGETLQLVVIDTLAAALSPDADENHAGTMALVAANLRRIAEELRVHVLTLHHPAKSGGAGGRGSSALNGAVDTTLILEREPSKRTAHIKAEKQRDLADDTKLAMDLEPVVLGRDQEGDEVTTVRAVWRCPDPSKEDSEKKAGADKEWRFKDLSVVIWVCLQASLSRPMTPAQIASLIPAEAEFRAPWKKETLERHVRDLLGQMEKDGAVCCVGKQWKLAT